MAQITIYLDADVEKSVRKAARSAGMSVSQWVAAAIREKTASEWPRSVLDLAGAWPDFPTTQELRQPQAGDSAREDF
jgi:hypothetical protein